MFRNSGFKRTLCGDNWSILGEGVFSGSSARIGCCSSGSFMSNPFYTPFLVAESCSICPLDFPNDKTTEPNDEITCNGKCPKGMYYDGVNGCQDCQAGKFNGLAGSTGNFTCKVCDLGRYSINPRSTACENCLGGKTTGGTGTFRTKDCKDCDKGRYSKAGAVCQNCSLAAYSERGSSVCEKCDVGQYMTAGNPRNCENCTAGKFSNYGKRICTECQQGQYANDKIAATGCESCPSGWYGSDAIVALRIDTTGACDECGIGKYSLVEGAKSKESCIRCQPGKKASSDIGGAKAEIDACTNCLVGQYRPSQIEVNGNLAYTDLSNCK